MATGEYARRTLWLLLSTDKRRKLSWLGNVCHPDALPNITLQGTVDGTRGR